MEYIENPILRGFHPDPSIIRVQEDYYIATSTFEWFPGVQIYHSRDLKNWELVARPLSRVSQLDLAGVPDSGGVWAPCLSYSNGVYYLVYTVVKSVDGLYKDTHNYLVTATDICGDWSEPVYLNSEGFDPSLFHDTDGRKWLVNMTWDMRRGKTCFGGIQLREYSPAQRRLVGESRLIFAGTELGITEGPHLYHVNGYYYLFTAEGGTHFGHALTVARSKTIEGPYEVDPGNPVLTSRDDVTLPLQRAWRHKRANGISCIWLDALSRQKEGVFWAGKHVCKRPSGQRMDGCDWQMGATSRICWCRLRILRRILIHRHPQRMILICRSWIYSIKHSGFRQMTAFYH